MRMSEQAKELERAFYTHLEEMGSCERNRCWWALLHLTVALPDVAASIEDVPGGAPGGNAARYMNWCEKYVTVSTKMTAADLYQMRCAILHEGTSIPGKPAKNQYVSFSFDYPGAATKNIHLNVNADTQRGGSNLTIAVTQLAEDMRLALKRWCEDVAGNANRFQAVKKQLGRLVTVREKESLVDGSNLRHPNLSST
jgi:hypothetical protein